MCQSSLLTCKVTVVVVVDARRVDNGVVVGRQLQQDGFEAC